MPKNVRGNIELSPDGRLVACGSETKGNVVLLDAATGEEVRTLDVSGSGLAFSPDSKSLAVWIRVPGLHLMAPTDVSVWNVADGSWQVRFRKLRIKTGPRQVSAVRSHQTGKRSPLSRKTADCDCGPPAEGKARTTLAEDADPHAFVGFLPDGTLIEADREKIRFWDPTRAKQSKPLAKVQDTADVYRLSTDGTRLARAGLFGVGSEDVATGREIGAGEGMPGRPGSRHRIHA